MSTPTGDSGQSYGPGDPQDAARQQQAGEQQYGDQQYGQPQYGQSPYPDGGAHQASPRNGLGIAALVLGILGLILTITVLFFWLGGLLGLLAIVFGIMGMSRAKKGQATNRGVAIGGLVTGILALLGALVITAVTVIFVGVGGGDFVTCMQQAGQDTAAQQQCAQQFQQQVQQGG